MKIGIVTLWDAFDNYGQQFQVYALQHFLRNNGHDAYIIRYAYKKDIRKKKWYEYFYTIKYIFDFRYIKNIFNNKLSKQKEKKYDRHFKDFANTYIAFSKKEYKNIFELKENPPKADVYIVGSDQVWNFSSQYKPYENKIRAHFLDFGAKETTRIAYAASFGKNSYGKSLQKFVKPFLENFDYVTCRENQGKRICDSMGIESKVTLDPVFLNCKEDYLSLIKDMKPLETEKYCLVYLLGNATDIPYDKIDEYAKINNVKIVCIPGKGLNQNRYEEVIPDPKEWLWYMANAEYIITNSFHGTAFSIILEKKFNVLPLAGKNAISQNDRLYTMLNLVDINNVADGMNCNPWNRTINYKDIKEKINKLNSEIGLLNYINGIKK